eukprot:5542108-Pyramimonas_sp.AAC.1
MNNMRFIYLKRATLEELLQDPAFDETVLGAFVRIRAGADAYRLVKPPPSECTPEGLACCIRCPLLRIVKARTTSRRSTHTAGGASATLHAERVSCHREGARRAGGVHGGRREHEQDAGGEQLRSHGGAAHQHGVQPGVQPGGVRAPRRGHPPVERLPQDDQGSRHGHCRINREGA